MTSGWIGRGHREHFWPTRPFAAAWSEVEWPSIPVWAGASVHEVGQVVAAAGPAGSAAVATAVVVKLTRVLLLAPVVATVSFLKRRSAALSEQSSQVKMPPVLPIFVLGFIVCAVARSAGIVPDAAIEVIAHVQTAALAAAMFGLGTAVRLCALVRSGGPALALGAVSTVVVGAVSLTGVLWLA